MTHRIDGWNCPKFMHKPKSTYLNPHYNILHGFNVVSITKSFMLDYAWFTIGSRGGSGVEKGALRRKFFEESLAVFLPLASVNGTTHLAWTTYFILSRCVLSFPSFPPMRTTRRENVNTGGYEAHLIFHPPLYNLISLVKKLICKKVCHFSMEVLLLRSCTLAKVT